MNKDEGSKSTIDPVGSDSVIDERIREQAFNDEFAAYLTATKERFDKYFDTLGYVCFVFDKSNPENKYVANISNVPIKGYMQKLTPFFVNWKSSLKKLNKNRNKHLRRVV